MYVVSMHCGTGLPGLNYQDRCRPHKRRNWIFTHEGLSAHAHNIVQEVEVHGWLLSVAVKKTILCCSFLILVANK